MSVSKVLNGLRIESGVIFAGNIISVTKNYDIFALINVKQTLLIVFWIARLIQIASVNAWDRIQNALKVKLTY